MLPPDKTICCTIYYLPSATRAIENWRAGYALTRHINIMVLRMHINHLSNIDTYIFNLPASFLLSAALFFLPSSRPFPYPDQSPADFLLYSGILVLVY